MKFVYLFLFAMWLLILGGGGIVVVLLGPIQISGFGEFDRIITSGVQAVTAVILVIIWVLVLSKIKNWIFNKQLKA
jgi:hypothetical protein